MHQEEKGSDAVVSRPQNLFNILKGLWVLFYWKASWKSSLEAVGLCWFLGRGYKAIVFQI